MGAPAALAELTPGRRRPLPAAACRARRGALHPQSAAAPGAPGPPRALTGPGPGAEGMVSTCSAPSPRASRPGPSGRTPAARGRSEGPSGSPRPRFPRLGPWAGGTGGGRVDCELLAGLGLPPSRPRSRESSPAAPPAARAPEGQPGRRPRPPASAGPKGPAGWEEAWELEASAVSSPEGTLSPTLFLRPPLGRSAASAAHSLHLLWASAPDRHTQSLRDTDAVNRRSCLSSRISPMAFSPGKTKPPGATYGHLGTSSSPLPLLAPPRCPRVQHLPWFSPQPAGLTPPGTPGLQSLASAFGPTPTYLH